MREFNQHFLHLDHRILNRVGLFRRISLSVLQKGEFGDEGLVNKRGSAVKPRMIMGLGGLLIFEPAERRNKLVNKQ